MRNRKAGPPLPPPPRKVWTAPELKALEETEGKVYNFMEDSTYHSVNMSVYDIGPS